MYSQIKAHWKEAYTLSANANFRKFLYNLKHGGEKAKAFIDRNADMMAMVCDDTDTLRAFILQDSEAAENKTYFFNLAMRQLPIVKAVLQNKFDSALTFAHGWYPDFDLDGLTPDNFLPELDRRQRAEAVQYVRVDVIKESTESDEEKLPELEQMQEQGTPEAEAIQEEVKNDAPKRKPRTKKS